VRLLGQAILPALALVPGNPGLCGEVWEAISTLPYAVRYRLYHKWKVEIPTAVPAVALAKAVAEKDARRILRHATHAQCRPLRRI
jgi:hypothetical protein